MSETNPITPGETLSPEHQKIAESERLAISLLEKMGFTVSRRNEEQEVNTISDQFGEKLRETSIEPAGFYTRGKFLANQVINGHRIVVAFTPQKNVFDTGIFVDDKYISGNHDFSEHELLNNIEAAFAVATFERDLGSLPTWTDEYIDFHNKYKELVANARSEG